MCSNLRAKNRISLLEFAFLIISTSESSILASHFYLFLWGMFVHLPFWFCSLGLQCFILPVSHFLKVQKKALPWDHQTLWKCMWTISLPSIPTPWRELTCLLCAHQHMQAYKQVSILLLFWLASWLHTLLCSLFFKLDVADWNTLGQRPWTCLSF